MGFIWPLETNSDGTTATTGSQQELGRDEFLQLLVTKLENQDPLSPMEDEDFVAQLAQFSSLEQMNNIADGIDTSNELDLMMTQSINNTMATDLIGNEIEAQYEGIWVDGDEEPKITFTLTSAAQELTFTISDSEGETVATFTETNLPAGVNSVYWDAKDSMGNTVDDGYYTVEVTGTDTNGQTMDVDLAVKGTVEAIEYRDGTAYLQIEGTDIPLGDVASVGQTTTSEWQYQQNTIASQAAAAGLVGNDVRAPLESVKLRESNEPELTFQTDDYAELVTFTIRDSDGQVVASLDARQVEAGVTTLQWDGLDEYGDRLPEGEYTVEVAAVDSGGNAVGVSSYVMGNVEAVIYRDGSAYLRVAGHEILWTDITAVGQPGTLDDWG